MKENVNFSAINILLKNDFVLEAFYNNFLSKNNCSKSEALVYIYDKFIQEDKFIAYEYKNILAKIA